MKGENDLFKDINNPTESDTSKSKKNIKENVERYIQKLKKDVEDFDEIRIFFKKNKDIFKYKNIDEIRIKDWENKEEKFRKKRGQFNTEFQRFIKSLDEIIENRTDYELELLFYIQYAQAMANRVDNRLQDRRIEKINELEKSLQKQEKNLKNVYIGFISFVSIFLSIFALISGNINFFTNMAKESNLKEITPLFLLVNAIILISIITMLYLVYYSLKVFIENRKNKFPIIKFYIVPIVIIIIAIFLIA